MSEIEHALTPVCHPVNESVVVHGTPSLLTINTSMTDQDKLGRCAVLIL